MKTKLFQLVLVAILASNYIFANEIPTPVFDKTAIYSQKIYKIIHGNEVSCHIEFRSTEEAEKYLSKSILYLENYRNKEIVKVTPLNSINSTIKINTLKLNSTNKYSCCLEIQRLDSQVNKKCSVLLISPKITSDLTIVAKIIGLLEMLVLILIFSLCLIVVTLRFKAKQKTKTIDAELKEITSEGSLNFSKPYIISPNAQSMQEEDQKTDDEKLKRAKMNFNIDLKTFTSLSESDFPPTYEETVLRRIEKQIESAKY